MKDKKKIVSYLGTVLMFISLGFIARRLITYGIDFSLLTSAWAVAGLLTVAAVEGLGMTAAGLNYRAAVKNVSGILVNVKLTLVVYAQANLYKYIPGGVMYVLGRNRLAVETDNLKHSKVALATVLEGGTIAIGAIIVAVLFAFEYTFFYIRHLEILPLIGLIIFIAAVVLVPVIYYKRHKFVPKAKELFGSIERPVWRVFLMRIGFAFLLMFMWGASFVATLALLGQPMSVDIAVPILGLYLLAWVIGFLTPGAPSGFGVREAVMIMFFGAIVDDSILLAAMVVHRVITVLGDLFCYLIAMGYSARKVKINEK